MRAFWFAALVCSCATGVLPGAAAAQAREWVDMARQCAAGPDRRARLETTERASAELECRLDGAGAPVQCALTSVDPDTPAVRAVALGRPCFAVADPALAFAGERGERLARFAYDFAIDCVRTRGGQVCATTRVRARQLGANAP